MTEQPPAEKDLLPCCRGEGPCQAPPDIGPCDPLPSAEKDVPPPDIRPGDYIVRPGIGSQVDAYVESAIPPADGAGHHPRCTDQHETIMGETACVLPPAGDSDA